MRKWISVCMVIIFTLAQGVPALASGVDGKNQIVSTKEDDGKSYVTVVLPTESAKPDETAPAEGATKPESGRETEMETGLSGEAGAAVAPQPQETGDAQNTGDTNKDTQDKNTQEKGEPQEPEDKQDPADTQKPNETQDQGGVQENETQGESEGLTTPLPEGDPNMDTTPENENIADEDVENPENQENQENLENSGAAGDENAETQFQDTIPAATGGGVGQEPSLPNQITEGAELPFENLPAVSGGALEAFVPIIDTRFPTSLDFMIDPVNQLGKGQIFSEDFVFENNSNVDLIITFQSLYYEFANDIDFRSLSENYSMENDIGLKDVYMYLDNVSEQPETDPVLVTDKVQTNCASFLLSKDKEAINNKQVFRLKGSVAPIPDIEWQDNDVVIRLNFAVTPVIPGEEAQTAPNAVTADTNVEPARDIFAEGGEEESVQTADAAQETALETGETAVETEPVEKVAEITDRETDGMEIINPADAVQILQQGVESAEAATPSAIGIEPDDTGGAASDTNTWPDAEPDTASGAALDIQYPQVTQENLLAAIWDEKKQEIGAFIILDEAYREKLLLEKENGGIADETAEDHQGLTEETELAPEGEAEAHVRQEISSLADPVDLEIQKMDAYIGELIEYSSIWDSRKLIDIYVELLEKEAKERAENPADELQEGDKEEPYLITLCEDRIEASYGNWEVLYEEIPVLEEEWKLDTRVIAYRFQDNKYNKWYIDGDIPYLVRTIDQGKWSLQYVDTGKSFFKKEENPLQETDIIFLFPERKLFSERKLTSEEGNLEKEDNQENQEQ